MLTMQNYSMHRSSHDVVSTRNTIQLSCSIVKVEYFAWRSGNFFASPGGRELMQKSCPWPAVGNFLLDWCRHTPFLPPGPI